MRSRSHRAPTGWEIGPLNLLHTRPKLAVAVSEHDRFGLVLEAAPYATLPQRFVEAVFVQRGANAMRCSR